jgi:hypothetical protein
MKRFPNATTTKAEDLTGRKFGPVTVLARDGVKNSQAAWLVSCALCGKQKTLVAYVLKQKTDTDNCGHGCVRKKAA